MATKKSRSTRPGLMERPMFGFWVAGFVLLMFVIGIALGWWRTATTSDDRMDAHSGMVDSNGPAVASLSDLLPRLEAKVAADPSDIGQRFLLAQTYLELGQTAKGAEHLRQLHKQVPNDNPTTILLATTLIELGKQEDLREASKLLDQAVREKPAVLPMARLYQGDIQMKLGNRTAAVKIWKDYLAKMPAADPRRGLFEEKIAQAGSKP